MRVTAKETLVSVASSRLASIAPFLLRLELITRNQLGKQDRTYRTDTQYSKVLHAIKVACFPPLHHIQLALRDLPLLHHFGTILCGVFTRAHIMIKPVLMFDKARGEDD